MAQGLTTDQWKASIDDYIASATNLYMSMSFRGFIPEHAVPIDPRGELLDGSHRVACALATDCKVWVVPQGRYVWAPAWGLPWFMGHGMGVSDLAQLQADWKEMTA